jgi:hypothetical protein
MSIELMKTQLIGFVCQARISVVRSAWLCVLLCAAFLSIFAGGPVVDAAIYTGDSGDGHDMALGGRTDLVIASGETLTLTADLTVQNRLLVDGALYTMGYELTVGGSLTVGSSGTLNMTDTGGAGYEGDQTAMSLGGSLTVTTGGTITRGGSANTITLVGTNNDTANAYTITSSSQQLPAVVLDGAEDGAAALWDTWTLQDDLTAAKITLTDGKFVDNAKTVTVNDATSADISIANTANILTSTGVWSFANTGTLTGSTSVKIYTLQVQSGTVTLGGSTSIERKVQVLSGTLAMGANHIAFNIDNGDDDFLDVDPAATLSSSGAGKLNVTINSGANVQQKAFTGTTIPLYLFLYDNTSSLTLTGDLSVSELIYYGAVNATGNGTLEATAGIVDFNGKNVTTSIFAVGNGASDRRTKTYFQGRTSPTAGTITITSWNTNASNAAAVSYFEFGSAIVNITQDWTAAYIDARLSSAQVSVKRHLDLANVTAWTPGTSTVTFNGTAADQTVTTNDQHFYDLTINNTTANAANDDVIFLGAVLVDRNLTLTDGEFDINTNDPNVTVLGNVSIAAAANVNAGSGTWTFSSGATSTLTDSTAAVQDLGAVALSNNTTVQQASAAKMTTLTIASGSTWDAAGNNFSLSASGAVGNSGTFRLKGNETFTNVTDLGTAAGAVTYYGNNTAGPLTLKNFSYFNLNIADLNGTPATYKPGGTLTVNGAFVLSDGTLDMATGNPASNFAGNFTITTGTWTKGSGAVTFTTNSQINANGQNLGTVVFD